MPVAVAAIPEDSRRDVAERIMAEVPTFGTRELARILAVSVSTASGYINNPRPAATRNPQVAQPVIATTAAQPQLQGQPQAAAAADDNDNEISVYPATTSAEMSRPGQRGCTRLARAGAWDYQRLNRDRNLPGPSRRRRRPSWPDLDQMQREAAAYRHIEARPGGPAATSRDVCSSTRNRGRGSRRRAAARPTGDTLTAHPPDAETEHDRCKTRGAYSLT